VRIQPCNSTFWIIYLFQVSSQLKLWVFSPIIEIPVVHLQFWNLPNTFSSNDTSSSSNGVNVPNFTYFGSLIGLHLVFLVAYRLGAQREFPRPLSMSNAPRPLPHCHESLVVPFARLVFSPYVQVSSLCPPYSSFTTLSISSSSRMFLVLP